MVAETTHRFYKADQAEPATQAVQMNGLKEKMRGFIDSYQNKIRTQQKTIEQLQNDKEQL